VDTAIRIDKLPCRGAPTYPTRSINSGRTHFLGSCPASADRHVVALPRFNGEASTPVYTLSAQGSWAHRPLHSCALHGRLGPDLAPVYTRRLSRSTRACAAQSLTSEELRLTHTTPSTHIIPAWWLVQKGQMPTQITYPNPISVLGARGDKQRSTIM
jgi:hypothetical protein